MSTLDDIATERQRLSERLAKLDGEREKLAAELAELEAAERVLSRFAEPRSSARGAGRRGRRSSTAQKTAGISLGDATLQAVAALGDGCSADQVRDYLANELNMQVRPNHLGMALQRHRRAGRLEQRDDLWFTPAAPE
jgi:hypothetical protein